MANEDLIGEEPKTQNVTTSVTLLEDLFCTHYVRLNCNGRAAALEVGYAASSAHSTAVKLLKKPHIQQRIREISAPLLSRAKINMETMLGQLGAIATYDRRRMFHPDGTRKLFTELDDETAAAISHMGPNDFVPHDKLKAIDMAMKHLGGYEKDNEQRRENLQIAVVFE